MNPQPNNPPQPPQNPPAPLKRRSSRFPKGTSGNPQGRPPGSRNQATLLHEALLEDHSEPVLRKLIEQAKAGEPHAQRLYLERVFPARKDRPIQLALGPVDTVSQIKSAMSQVTRATAEGHITPLEGETLTAMLATQSQVLTLQELQDSIEQLRQDIAALKRDEGPSNSPVIDIAAELVEGRNLLELSRDPA